MGLVVWELSYAFETRRPAHLWPFTPTMPTAFASDTNFASRSLSNCFVTGLRILAATFMCERYFGSIGELQ